MSTSVPKPSPLIRLSRDNALRLNGLILVTFLAASSAPSPLYAIYQAEWTFSALTLVIVFSSYTIALLGALLVFGELSDYRGRREVLLVALGLECVAMLLFRGAESVNGLLVARVLQGLATGVATSAIGAGLIDLHRERGTLVNSIAPMAGLGLGALGTSALVQFAPTPTKLAFDVLLIVFALLTAAAFFLPETVVPRPGALRSLKPTFDVPVGARPTMWTILPVNTAQWALGGFYLSLGPTLAHIVADNSAPLIGGALIAALVISSAVAIALTRRLTPRSALLMGAGALGTGIGATLVGIQLHHSLALFAGTMLAGAGFGSAFLGSMRSLVSHAAAHERASLMSGYFVRSYLAFSLPTVPAGLLADRLGLEMTAMGFGLVLMALAAISLSIMVLRRTA
jgi:hypothetical protein